MKTFKQYLAEAGNKHLTRAKKTKDDEFYTSYDDALKMTAPFARHLAGKKVLCNCDDPSKSQVYAMLRDNFGSWRLKQLVGVGYKSKMEILTADDIKEVEVKNNGDFRTGESLEALKDCDVVVSNPPFSDNMFIDFIKLAMENGKDLVAIGPLMGAKAVDIKPYIIDGKLFAIKSPYQKFIRPDNAKSRAKTVNVAVYTTFPEDPFGKTLPLSKDTDIMKLPVDDKSMVPVSISHDGKFSIREIPADPAGSIGRIIVPLHVFRTNWRNSFKIIDIINTVKCNGKKLMSGVLMEYK